LGLFPQPALMFAFKGSDAIIYFRCSGRVGSEVRTAGDRIRRRRLNKLSCAGWLPHDRGFVSGLPRSSREHRSGDRLITGQEDSPPRSCRRQCARADLLLSYRVIYLLYQSRPVSMACSFSRSSSTMTYSLPAPGETGTSSRLGVQLGSPWSRQLRTSFFVRSKHRFSVPTWDL